MIILLTGGAACGKSSFGEKLCSCMAAPRYYLAAMKPDGLHSREKIAKHRKMRAGKGFETIERYRDYVNLSLPYCKTVLLECICNLTANEMFDENGAVHDPRKAVIEGVRQIAAQCDDLVIITNEVGGELWQYEKSTQDYVRALGEINCSLAEMADCVCELVCGIALVRKGKLPEVAL